MTRHLWVLSSESAFADLPASLQRGRWRVHRLRAIRFEDEDPARLRQRLASWGAFDTVLVTSPRAVDSFVRPVLGTPPGSVEVWAGGEETARRLRAVGIRRVRLASVGGADELVRKLARGRRRTLVYPRSDAAGPRVARQLRRQGHRVLDLVTYRTVRAPRPSKRVLRSLASADLVLLASPSAIAAWQSWLPAKGWSRIRGRGPLVALGARTQRSARRRGLRGVGCLSAPSVEGLTAYLARGDRHGQG